MEKIIDIEHYFDGGTYEIVTNNRVICVDGRIATTTKNYLYNGYPKGDNSNIIENQEETKKELLELFKVGDFYDDNKSDVDDLIEIFEKQPNKKLI